ncbi:Trafficking protein particle complex subunit 12 [Rhizoclosmatium sp. JEL0117]|nr:Trafficking protein particle complex subunit 12 [Rhizoclosmatium sp. JEL0117]
MADSNRPQHRFSVTAGGLAPVGGTVNDVGNEGAAVELVKQAERLSVSDVSEEPIPFSSTSDTLPPLGLPLQPIQTIDLTRSNPSLNIVNVSGQPTFTSAMEIAGIGKSTFPPKSRSPSPSRPRTPTQQTNTLAAAAAALPAPQQTSQIRPKTAPAGLSDTADFSVFRSDDDAQTVNKPPPQAQPLPRPPSRSPTPKLTPLRPVTPPAPTPSASTLFATSTTDPSTSSLPTKKWTLPIHFHDIPSAMDPVNDVLVKAFPFNSGVRPQRKLMSLHDAQLKYGKDPLKAVKGLAEARSWRSCAILAATVIKSHADGRDVDSICAWWAVRFVALEKLRMWEVLRVELESVFGGLCGGVVNGMSLGSVPSTIPRLSYEDFENGGAGIFKNVNTPRYGNVVAWEVRVIWAREPSLRGSTKESLERIIELAVEANSYIKRNLEKDLWISRIRSLNLLTADLLVEEGQYRAASNILRGVIDTSATKDAELYSALARIELQIGNMAEASKWIQAAERELCLKQQVENTSILPSTDFSKRDVILTNRALFAVASSGDWKLASTHLTELLEYAHSIQPPPTSISSSYSIPVIVNNISVCHLYSGNVAQALSHLESLMLELPQVCGGSASLVFNLATLYDLTDNSMERKRRLLGGVVASYAGDDLEGGCLKL